MLGKTYASFIFRKSGRREETTLFRSLEKKVEQIKRNSSSKGES